MTDTIKIPMTFQSDEKGYLDRQCPNKNCEYVFKINMDDWKEKITDKVYCPMCGYIASSDQWYTDEQIEVIRENAKNYAMNMVQSILNKSFNKLANSTRNNKYIKITYKPSKKISVNNNPIGQREEWNLDINCEKCGTRYSVIGSAYFCPCCGHNSVEKVFESSISRIETMLNAQDFMFEKLTEQVGTDEASKMCRSMLEGTLGDIISAFQKFAKENLISHSSLDTSKIKVNDFQIIAKGSELYRTHLNKPYENCLSAEELTSLNILFQRRHILEHNEGIIDEKYIEKSGDKTYTIGQRVIVKKDDAEHLLKIIKKLTTFLK